MYSVINYLTSDEDSFVAELLTVVNNSPAGVDVDLFTGSRTRVQVDLQWSRYDGLWRAVSWWRHLAIEAVTATRQRHVVFVVVVETPDEVQVVWVCVDDDTRLRTRVSHYVPSTADR